MAVQQTAHGRKRKRYTDKPASKFQTKLHHGIKEAKKAAKLTKAFEVQKLVKKLKGLREKSAPEHEVQEAEAQLSALKDIDCESFAAVALYRKLRKDKHIMSYPDASTAMATELPTVSTAASTESKPKTAEAIVESRLASSKLLAKELNGIVAGLRALVWGPNEDAEDEGGLGDTGSDNEPEDEEDEEGSEAADDNTARASDVGWDSGSISPDDGGDSDHSTDLNSDVELPPTKRQKKSAPLRVQVGATDLSAKKKHDPKPSHPSLKDDSTFLPSLSVGFTKGDSDISGSEIDSDAGSVGPVRKNRRGQRARQQIWEKKYGKNARHIKKRKEEEVEENVAAAYGPRGRGRRTAPARGRGAPNDRGRGRGRGVMGPASLPKALAAPTGRANPAPVPPNKKGDAPMHPSWEAAKKRKDQAMVVPFQGKKVVF